MNNLFSQVLALGLIVQLSSACGETVNYDTEEKIADAALNPGAGNGGGDAVSETNPDVSNPDDGSTIGTDGLPTLCHSAAVQVKRETLVFPEIASGTTCNFGSGENLSKKDGYFRAYLRQTQIVTLPEGAILCGFSLAHQPAAMRYDDEMFFSVNNKLLLSTKDFSEHMPKTDFFRSFSWDNLKDKRYDSLENRPVFCAGGAEGLSQCGVPPTETQGNIELKFGEEMNNKLAQALQNDRDLTFEWITTGDNDTSDCRHTEIDLALGLSYVIP